MFVPETILTKESYLIDIHIYLCKNLYEWLKLGRMYRNLSGVFYTTQGRMQLKGFKRSLKSELVSFSTGCPTKSKGLNLSYYLLTSRGGVEFVYLDRHRNRSDAPVSLELSNLKKNIWITVFWFLLLLWDIAKDYYGKTISSVIDWW